MQSVLVVEDVRDVREWLVDVVAETFPLARISAVSTLQQARQVLAQAPVELAIIDLGLPDGSGVELIRDIADQQPQSYSVVATIFDDDDHVFDALKAGAKGYLLKDEGKEAFCARLSGILRGEPALSPRIARKIIRHFHQPAEAPNGVALSGRENEILALTAKGYRRHEIADMLSISQNTVASHMKTIYSKLNVSTRADATVEALRLGLIRL